MLEEDVHHQLEVVVEHPDHLLRRHLLRDAGEPPDVAEEDGQLGQRPALRQLDAAARRLLHQRRRKESRELRALGGLELERARIVAVLERHRRLRRDRGEDLQVLGGEGGDALAGIEEHDPLHVLARGSQQGNRHGAAHAERDDRVRGLEALVRDGVGGEDPLLGELDLRQKRVGDQHFALARLALPHGLDDEVLRVRVAQQDHAVVAGDEVERDLEDAREQLVEIPLQADVGGELVPDPKALVVALELVDVLDLLDRHESRLRRGPRDHAFQLSGLTGVHDLRVLRPGRSAGEAELHLRGADDHFVAVAQGGRRDEAFPVEERSVRGLEIAQDVPVAVPVDLAVFARDLAVGEPHRRGGAAPDHAAVVERVFGHLAWRPLEDQSGSGRRVGRTGAG